MNASERATRTIMDARRRDRPGFGVALPTSGDLATPAEIYRVAARAEQLGYDDVWVNDHISVSGQRASARPTQRDPDFFESLTTLAAVGGRVHRIGLAVHSLVLPLRDPRLFAKQIATIHELSDGRLTVAPGIGSSREDYAALGIPFEERGRRLDEHLGVLARIFHDPAPVAYEGRYVRMAEGWFYPRPRTIELWITGDSEPGLRRVARWGTGWFSSGWASLDDYARLGERLDELLLEEGRDPRAVERATDPFVCVTRTREEATAIVDADPRLARRPALLIAGDPAEARSRIAAYLRAGVTYLELRLVARDAVQLGEMMELVAGEVISEFRDRRVGEGRP